MISYTISPRRYRVPCDLDWHLTVRARRIVICISDLHQNDTRTGCLVARQTTNHWAHATGPWPGCDMTRHDFSCKDGNAVCVQLAPPHSYTSLASASSSPAAAHSSCHQCQYPRHLVSPLGWAVACLTTPYNIAIQ